MKFRLPLLCIALLLPTCAFADDWRSIFGKGDGTFESATFRVERSPGVVVTLLPARGATESRVRVELDAVGNLLRSRTDYLVASLSDWYRADFLLTEVQPGQGEGGRDNLAFQRVWKNQVQEAKNLVWGPNFVEFSTLPVLLEQRLARAALDLWKFKSYSGDTQGDMQVRIVKTDRPLDIEKRYAYPRWLREKFGQRTLLVAELTATGDLKGGYPYPFYYAFTVEPRWIAAWGGNPRSPTFQWRE